MGMEGKKSLWHSVSSDRGVLWGCGVWLSSSLALSLNAVMEAVAVIVKVAS